MDGQSFTYTQSGNQVTEKATPGWTLKDITCTGAINSPVHITGASGGTAAFEPGDDTVTIDLADPHVTCTFTNSQDGPTNRSCLVDGALNISTGTGTINSGIPDPIWTVSSPAGPAYPVAYAGWAVASAGSNWIHAGNNSGGTDQPLLTYVYETSFNLPVGVASIATAFSFAADNNVSIVLTGPSPFAPVQISPVSSGTVHNNFLKLHPATPTSITMPNPNDKLPAGKYKLTATVGNPDAPSPSGLLVVGNITCVASPTPTPTPPKQSCVSGEALNISTGQAGIGNQDLVWTVNGGAAAGINVVDSWAVPPAGKSPHWIAAGNTSASNVYEMSFSVPANVASLTLAFQFAADNNVSFDLSGPSNNPSVLNFASVTGNATSNFSTLHSTSPNPVTITAPNPSEKLPAGKYKLRATVGNQAGTISGLLVVGNITCVASSPRPTPTFTPTPTPTLPCIINISKETTPASNVGFTFNATWTTQPTPFTISPGTTFSAQVPCDHTYNVTEKSTPGWTLTSIGCAVVSGTGSFVVSVPTVRVTVVHPGDIVNCQFNNAVTKQCGDVNDDGTVNALDALAMLQNIAGLTHDLRNAPSADVNGDGTINALDVLLLLQHIAGFDVRLTC